MALLLITSFIWAFSFGLIKKYLGGLDASFVAFVRLALAFLLFLPLLRPRKISAGHDPAPVLDRHGPVRPDVRFLHPVVPFSGRPPGGPVHHFHPAVTWPWPTTCWEKRFRPLHFWTALLAVAGTAVIVYSGLGESRPACRFLLVQASNLCFALGQVCYRRLLPAGQGLAGPRWLRLALPGRNGRRAAGHAAFFRPAPSALERAVSCWSCCILGLLASGVGFFLWNVGATRVPGRHSGRFQQCQDPPGRPGLAAVFRRADRLAAPAWRRRRSSPWPFG